MTNKQKLQKLYQKLFSQTNKIIFTKREDKIKYFKTPIKHCRVFPSKQKHWHNNQLCKLRVQF